MPSDSSEQQTDSPDVDLALDVDRIQDADQAAALGFDSAASMLGAVSAGDAAGLDAAVGASVITDGTEGAFVIDDMVEAIRDAANSGDPVVAVGAGAVVNAVKNAEAADAAGKASANAMGNSGKQVLAEDVSSQSKGDSHAAVIAAIVGNILVGVVKFIAAAISSSVAMLSEGIHSIVDSGNGLLILFGLHQAKKDPDFTHPFGYGKELYFWTMVVALCIFLLGGGVSIYKGVQALEEAFAGGRVLGNPTLSYIVIVIAAIIEGSSLTIAIRQFNAARGDISPLRFIRDVKDPSLYTVVLEDSAAELGLLFAFLGTFLSHLTGNLVWDGAASICIGVLLCTVAVVLLGETKGLLVGEGMKHAELDELRAIVEAHPRVAVCGRILTMYMGPDSLLVTIDATFRDDITAHEVLEAVDQIESIIIDRFPQTTRVFIEVESMRAVRMQRIEEEHWEDEDEEDED